MKWVAAAAFVSTVYLANWTLTTFGVVDIGIGPGVPAGVAFAGLGFLLRDAVHELGGRRLVFACIAIGSALSYLLGASVQLPGGFLPLAACSGIAFAVSELADYACYAPLRERTLTGAVAVSQVAGSAVDSALFLWLAFGSMALWPSQTLAKIAVCLPALALLHFPPLTPRSASRGANG